MNYKKYNLFSSILYIAFIIFLAFTMYIEFASEFYFNFIFKIMIYIITSFLLYTATVLKTKTFERNDQKRKYIKTTIFAIFILYFVFLLSMLYFDKTFRTTPNYSQIGGDYFDLLKARLSYGINLIPFATIKNYITGTNSVNPAIVFINIIGNLFAFAPFGFFLPYFFKKTRKFLVFLLTILGLVLCVEITQFFTMTGIFDIDDIILNSAGAIFLFLILKNKTVSGFVSKFTLSEQVN